LTLRFETVLPEPAKPVEAVPMPPMPIGILSAAFASPGKPGRRYPTMARIFRGGLLLLLLIVGAAGADAAEAATETPLGAPPARVATRHSIVLAGRRLDYQAIAETLPLVDAKGNPTAAIFTVTYVVDRAAGAVRPVSFVFNGGPGAASVFLHLGALGPRILATPVDGAAPEPPFRLVDNEVTWLAFTDLVFIDPVGTGFSRGIGKAEDPDKPFFDVPADLDSLAATIRLWLTRHRRWGSPVYLVGESYGGFRAAALAQALPRDGNATVSGLVLISPALDLSALNPGPRDLLASAFFLPSYAAVAAAREPRSGDDIAGVERFALSGYLTGLAALKGRPDAADPFIAKVAALAGLPETIVRRYRGRIPRHVFAREIRRPENEVVSVYDGTIARPAVSGASRGDADDPLLRSADAAFGAAFNAYAADELGYHTDLPYRVLARQVVREWDWQEARREGEPGLAMEALQTALLDHPGMRVLIANGCYDLVTPYLGSRWLVDQLELPDAVRNEIHLRLYKGGHMIYLRPESRRALAGDAARIYPAPIQAAPIHAAPIHAACGTDAPQ
jgi:carboxypeptidase C (cathepsin A)